MTANESKILGFVKGEDKSFAIPVFQRPYSWKKENCVQLLKDLTDVFEFEFESHFFGSVVFVCQKYGMAEENMIIDGQQRITTISLLLIAIRDYVSNHIEINININTDEITQEYLTVLTSNGDRKIKLRLVKGDNEAYENLVDGRTPIENTNITVNYSYFYNELCKMDKEKVKGLYDAISKLDLVGICLEPYKGDDPQSTFESLNSTGQDLETVDKIRNFVMMRMDGAKQERFYKKYWEPFEKSCNKKDINYFIRYYLAVKNRKLSSENKVYTAFKTYQTQHEISEEDILADMLEYAQYYNLICHPESANNKFRGVLSRINKLDIKSCVPFIMDLLKANTDGRITDDETMQTLEIVENYIVRREICDLGTHSLNQIFVQFVSDIDKDTEGGSISYFEVFKHQIMKKTGKSRFPNNHDFKDKFPTYDLYNAKMPIKQYILERLENYNNKERLDVEAQISNQELTIEHVMPQTLSSEWKEALGEKWELIYSKYVHTPGNLTLTAYNRDYSNFPFLTKRDLPEKGFIYSKLSLNDFIKQCNTWGEKEILDRADILYEKAEKIWWIPDDPIEGAEEAEWHNWDEEFDVTDCKIPQIIIMDKPIDTKDMTEAYKKINEILYELEPMIYQESELSWFGRSEDELKGSPYQIGENAYIETHRSSLEKLNYIKAIAELFDLSPEDIQLLVQPKIK